MAALILFQFIHFFSFFLDVNFCIIITDNLLFIHNMIFNELFHDYLK